MIVRRGLLALAVGIGVTAAAGVATAASAGHAAKACETSGHQLRLLTHGHCAAGLHAVTLGAGARGKQGPAGPSESYSFNQDKNLDLFKITTPSSHPMANPVAVMSMSRLVPGVYQVSGEASFTVTGNSNTDAAMFDCTSTRSGLTFDAEISTGRAGSLSTRAEDSEIKVIPASAGTGRDVLDCAVVATNQVTDTVLHNVVITAVRMAKETTGP